jgi:L-threonylcarbamoyladenylate synthase
MNNLITQAATSLAQGGLISLPTETVYSLSVNAYSDNAVKNIYKLKGRKQDNPLALLVGNIETAREMVVFNKYSEMLADAFFPGSLTLILPKQKNTKISKFVNEGLNTLAVRMPANKTTLAILNMVDFPVIGTSANPSGLPPATNAQMVNKYFPEMLDLIIDEGNCEVGVASTILDLCGDIPTIIRHGYITIAQIEEQLGCKVV